MMKSSRLLSGLALLFALCASTLTFAQPPATTYVDEEGQRWVVAAVACKSPEDFVQTFNSAPEERRAMAQLTLRQGKCKMLSGNGVVAHIWVESEQVSELRMQEFLPFTDKPLRVRFWKALLTEEAKARGVSWYLYSLESLEGAI